MTDDNNFDLEISYDDEEIEQKKSSQALEEILIVLAKYRLRVQDLVLTYANLGYSIGASIENIKEGDEGPSLEELQKSYHTKPTIGVALMLQGILTSSWYEDIIKNKENDNDRR